MKKSSKYNDRNILVKHIAIALGCFAMLGLLVYAATTIKKENSSLVNIKIDTLGETKSVLIEKDIRNIIERTYGYDLVGVPVNDIDVLSVEDLLKNVPHIKDANVYIDAQKRVHINVQPRKAILRVVDEFGSNYFLDEDGVRLPVSTNFTPRVLVAHGSVPQYHDRIFIEKEGVLYDIYKLSVAIKNDSFLSAQIDQVYINKNMEAELIPKIGNQEIRFGKIENIEDKLENLVAFYKDGIAYKGWKTYNTIDLRYDKQVVCNKIRS